MKYFTAEEARAIMDYGCTLLCRCFENNPNLEAAQALAAYVRENCRYDPCLAAVYGFCLGRAVGIREERQRRKAAQS